ncbi:class I SAM-dependent methyltransferase [uncultured Ferrimonas sp.]|uniref:class I SAM-dependent methyltransferase n=1 Tax=uncultured Ferrimonas sp. TaxID=432640 RepID=UPI00261D84C6|nr:class I SAM-dependent methyltransferase [uncultured Ferrimonas sp.]
MPHQNPTASALLLDHLELFNRLPDGPVLDLACGSGRNGLRVAAAGHSVWFVDRDRDALARVEQQALAQGSSAVIWQQNLEDGHNPFAERRFAAILGFHYLHRPLLPWLAQAILPGGLIVYETFTQAHPQHFGRPSNPNFLLQPNELAAAFASWEQIHYREGIHPAPQRCSAQLVARKPK